MKKIIIVLLLILLLTGCKEQISTDIPDEILIESRKENIEVYSDIFLHDLIINTNSSIVSENDLIDTTKLGKNSYEVVLEYNKKKYLYKFELDIVDTTIPKILGGSSKTVLKNNEDNFCDSLLYGDNYDTKPSCLVEGNYDTSSLGSYNLKYVVTDNSNNVATKDFILNIVASTNSSSYEPSTITFSEALQRYKNDNTELGLDISRWQGDVDFEKVKEEGASFVILRMGVQVSSKDEIEMDSKFLEYLEGASNAGLKVGVYVYTIAIKKETAIKQAAWVIENLKGYKLDLPIVFDWEAWTWWNEYNLSFYSINDIANSFIETVNKNGYEGMLYSSKFYLENIWENKKDYPVWLAHFTNSTSYSGNYKIWQFTDTGLIDGIDGYVDINVLYK